MNNKKRKLRAILFADIVGYTALMQKDEAGARQNLEKFRQTLKEQVKLHDGEIINNYGDGCLCTFESAVDALTCAKEVQLIFQSEPKVPVRIGLHSGDVFFEDNNVFGDSVNIASRIESLGVAGAVLFSQRVKRDIANQKVFEVQSLGSFDFKNVEKSMEIFSLANEGLVIPKRSEIQGKLKPQKNKWMIPLVILGMLAIAFGYWKINVSNGIDLQGSTSNKPAETPLSEAYRQKRVAVMVFENKTQSENLEDFGTMVSDWITKGLMETGEANIISAANLQPPLAAANFSSQGNPEFAQKTGAEVVVKGRYYLQEDQLIISCDIIDVNTGRVIHAMERIQGKRNNLLQLLDELTQEVLGYWAVKGQSKFLTNPPKYEAYQAYKKGREIYRTDAQQSEQYLKKAFQLDTTFFVPLLQLVPLYNATVRFEKFDSLINFIQQLNPNFTEWESLRFESFKSLRTDWAKSISVNRRMFELDPSDWFTHSNVAEHLIQSNFPQQALDFLEAMEKKYPLSNPLFSRYITEHQVSAYFFKDNHEEVLNLMQKNSSQEVYGNLAAYHLKSLIRLNQLEEIDDVLENYERKDIFGYGFFLQKDFLLKVICNELHIQEKKEELLKYTDQLRIWTTKYSKGNELNVNMGLVHWYSEDYQQALKWWKKEQYSENNLINLVFKYMRLGLCYAKQNLKEAAHSEIERIQKLPEPGVVLDDVKHLGIANIQANLGQKKQAMESLRLAIEKGAGWLPGIIGNTAVFPFQNTSYLKPMFGYPPFEELVKPKG